MTMEYEDTVEFKILSLFLGEDGARSAARVKYDISDGMVTRCATRTLGTESRDGSGPDFQPSAVMISAGVFALRGLCPFDFAFPVGGEDDAVEAVLKAAWHAQYLEDSENTQESPPDDLAHQ